MSFLPDLDAYFARIGYAGPRAPTLETLSAIAHAHVSSIPFENLDVLLDRGIDLDPRAVEDKLVHARRGGYCFEHNSHLLHVLTALGFEVTPLSARVRVGRPREMTPPRTHMFVRAIIDGAPHLADVGVGGLSPTAALSLDTEDEQATPHEPRRLVREGGWSGELRAPTARIFHQAKLGEEWADVCELTLEPMPEIDRIVGNWYTSTHPRSHFRDRLMAARAIPGGRLTLLDRQLTRRDASGTTVRRLASHEELLAVLGADFGLALSPDTRLPCPWIDWSAP